MGSYCAATKLEFFQGLLKAEMIWLGFGERLDDSCRDICNLVFFVSLWLLLRCLVLKKPYSDVQLCENPVPDFTSSTVLVMMGT